MNSPVYTDAARRHDFTLLFDVMDGNPNGDPDAGNMPRVDPETMQGLVTDVCLKRKVRDWVLMAKNDQSPFMIYVQSGVFLNDQQKKAYAAQGLPPKAKDSPQDHVTKGQKWMCANFFDVRLFGAVMGVGDARCGQVKGPLQLTFARSIDPVTPLDLTITRVAETNPSKPAAGDPTASDDEQRTGTMARKHIVPYGLYVAHGFFNPHFAAATGADGADLALVWQALPMMWDVDRSAARGLMSCRGLYVFSHASPLGNAPAHQLFDRVRVTRKTGVSAPRLFSDYEVTVDASALPEGVTLSRLVG